MPGRTESVQRRRRELLRALLEEEEEQASPLGEAELVALLRQLRREQQGELPSLAGLSQEQIKGFLWGVGAAVLLIMVMPAAKETLRPLAVSTVKGALGLADQFKTLLAGAGEGLQDIIAEAQFERMRDSMGPDVGAK